MACPEHLGKLDAGKHQARRRVRSEKKVGVSTSSGNSRATRSFRVQGAESSQSKSVRIPLPRVLTDYLSRPMRCECISCLQLVTYGTLAKMKSPRSSFRSLTLFTVLTVLFGALFLTARAEADPSISGTYLIDGKPVQLKYAKAVKGEAFADKETTLVILSEKDGSKSKKPDIDAMFGKFGGALVLTITSDGELVGTQIVKDKVQFSTSGNIKLSDYKVDGDNVSGKVASEGQQKFFENTWQIDLTFSVAAP